MRSEIDVDVLSGLRGLYLKQLKERLYTLEQAMIDMKLGLAGPDRYEGLAFEVHRLNGTGATYGFPKISSTASTLENCLRSEDPDQSSVMKLLDALTLEIGKTLTEQTSDTRAHNPVFVSKSQGRRSTYKPTILVADDDPAMLNLIEQLLSSWANVECVERGDKTIEALERRRFDLVILDCEFPDMTALDILTYIGKTDLVARSPVMMLTAVREPTRITHLIAAGAQYYMVKPIAPDQLIERVSVLLNRQRKMILIVDDDPLIREIFRKRFSQRGYEVAVATNGAHALNVVRKIHPQAIILDRQMPRLDGIQVLQELRREKETRSIPVIMLSALARSDDMYSGYREGADAYIAKPFLPDQVIDCCEELLKPNDMSAQIASAKATWENSVFV